MAKNIYFCNFLLCYTIIVEVLVDDNIQFHHRIISAPMTSIFLHSISVAIPHCDGSISQSGVKTFHNRAIHPHSGAWRGENLMLCALCHIHKHTNRKRDNTHTTGKLSHLSRNKWAAPLLSVSLIWMKELLGDLTTLISTPMESVQYSCSWWNTLPGDATLPPQMIPPAEQRLSAMKGQW